MPLSIIRDDITRLKCDAIVNPTGKDMVPSGGLDAAIHKAAGPKLASYCKKIGSLDVGDVKLTPGFDLPAKFIIHTVGPVWQGGRSGERSLLRLCYIESMKMAVKHSVKSIAFPLISSGLHGYPKELVLKEAMEILSECLSLTDGDMQVYIVIYDKQSYAVSKALVKDIESFIDDNIESPDKVAYEKRRKNMLSSDKSPSYSKSYNSGKKSGGETSFSAMHQSSSSVNNCSESVSRGIPIPADSSGSVLWEDSIFTSDSLDDVLKKVDKGFAQTLFYYIDKKGMDDVAAYKSANVSRKTFSKIKSNSAYKPSKITAISFAIGMRLSIEETQHLLSTAGMCLSKADKFDLIIEYFIRTGRYKDIHHVNEILFDYDMRLLGA